MRSEEKEKKQAEDGDELDYILKSGSVISRGNESTIHCLTIIGQIEGHYLLGEGQKL